jgi:hypothetical protein
VLTSNVYVKTHSLVQIVPSKHVQMTVPVVVNVPMVYVNVLKVTAV